MRRKEAQQSAKNIARLEAQLRYDARHTNLDGLFGEFGVRKTQ